MIRLFKTLIVLLGIGVGVAIMLLIVQAYELSNPGKTIPMFGLVLGYGLLGLAGGFVFYLLKDTLLQKWMHWSGTVEKRLDKMPVHQLTASMLGLILGLLVAALLCRVFSFMGTGIVAVSLSAILYLVLGSLGFSIGRKRGAEFSTMIARLYGMRERQRIRKTGISGRKLLDTSAIIDGRILEIVKTGFVEGDLVIPQFVVDELRHVADSSDESKRERGRRGLEMLQTLRTGMKNRIRLDETEYADVTDVDVKLLRLAKQTGSAVITCDYNLNKAAAISEIRVLNVNELANAMRPAVSQGQDLRIRITREGREAGQGLAYMSDGTMIVVEGGGPFVGNEINVVVTSILQTSAGRMVFAKLKEA